MRDINVIFRQFDHGGEDCSEVRMADIIRASAQLAGGQPITKDLLEYREVHLKDEQISVFCLKVEVLALSFRMSEEDDRELKRIIDAIEDNRPAALAISATENITTMRGIFSRRPGDFAKVAAATLANYEAERPAFRARHGLPAV